MLQNFFVLKNVNTALFDDTDFNEHFATIGEKLAKHLKQNVYRSNFPVNKNTFDLYDTSRYEILKEIKTWTIESLLVMIGYVVKWFAKILPL